MTYYWIGKDSLKCWRRMYLESFEYFVNNCDISQSTTLPLNPDLMSSVCDTSSSILDNKNFFKSPDSCLSHTIGGITVESLTNSLKLSSIFVDNSELIFKILKLNDYQPFHCSLLELHSVLKEMMNIFTSVIAKKINEELAIKERKSVMNRTGIKVESELETETESVDQTDNEHKEDDIDDNSHEEKDKQDDSDSSDNKNDMECMSWIFNEDITCSHGNLLIINLHFPHVED